MFKGKSVAKWICLLPLMCAAYSVLAQSKEYQVKAVFLFNFAQFVEWPTAAFSSDTAPFQIGILGDDPFGAALDETVQGETIRGRKLVILRSHSIHDVTNCQMVFISRTEKSRATEIISRMNSRPVLTVSDMEDFARRGGIINFYQEKTKVRFEINATAAQQSGLKISSQMLSLGKIVGSSTEKEGK